MIVMKERALGYARFTPLLTDEAFCIGLRCADGATGLGEHECFVTDAISPPQEDVSRFEWTLSLFLARLRCQQKT
jgi:hypothetical protein